MFLLEANRMPNLKKAEVIRNNTCRMRFWLVVKPKKYMLAYYFNLNLWTTHSNILPFIYKCLKCLILIQVFYP